MKIEDFIYLVENAIKAPSGHNTQPWKFENIQDGIKIHPDFARALPVVDADNHALYISLGCALENIIIAASKRGYGSKVIYPADANSGITVKLNYVDADSNIEDNLFDYIAKRQVNRSKYSDKKINDEKVEKLKSSFNFEGVSIVVMNGKTNFGKIIPLIIEGNNLQFQNKEFIKELTSWFRYSKSEAEKTRDGLWTAAMGLPNMGKLIGNFVMKNFVSAKSEAKRLADLLENTQGIAIFIADKNDVATWVKTGQAFHRFSLTATMLGISHSHLNMPCEELEVRKKLAKELGVENKHPLLLIRYGYADKIMPYSNRRNVDVVIIK